MTTAKQPLPGASAQAVALLQKAIDLNKQATTLMQTAVHLTQHINALLNPSTSGSPRATPAPPAKQGQPKQKQAPITKEVAARIQLAADRGDGRERSRSSGYLDRRCSSWDDDDY